MGQGQEVERRVAKVISQGQGQGQESFNADKLYGVVRWADCYYHCDTPSGHWGALTTAVKGDPVKSPSSGRSIKH